MQVKLHTQFKSHKGSVYCLAQAAQESCFYSGGSDQMVIEWDLSGHQSPRQVARVPSMILSLCYLPKQNYLIIGQGKGGIHVIDLASKKEIRHLAVHQGYVFALHYLEEQEMLVASAGDGRMTVWTVPDFELYYSENLSSQKLRAIAYSDQRKEIAVASGDGSVHFFNPSNWQKTHRLSGFRSSVNCLEYSADGRFLLAGEKDAYLSRLEFRDGIPIRTDEVAAHNWAIYGVQFQKDEKWMATASRDKTIKIWDPKELQVLRRIQFPKDPSHTHSVNTLLWSRFQDQLITAGDDGVIRAWEILA